MRTTGPTQPPYRIAQAGLGLVPEGRQIFPTLTVEENLIATAASRFTPRWTLDRVYDFFPQLAERRRHLGDELSGGEQQMLAIGRALMTNPKLLILDEATEGLAPLLRHQIWTSLARLKEEGQAVLIVDKHFDALVKLAERHTIIEKGQVVWTGTSATLAADPSIAQRYLSSVKPGGAVRLLEAITPAEDRSQVDNPYSAFARRRFSYRSITAGAASTISAAARPKQIAAGEATSANASPKE